MEQIYVIGDIHTVSAFRLAGVAGVVADRQNVSVKLEDVIRRRDAAIVAVTNDLADDLAERISAINLQMPAPVVVAIPGIDDTGGLGRSAMSYISEALGIPL